MLIWAHTIVKNEDLYLWYAVSSVIEHVDKVLLWDTGSSDNTLSVIKELQNRYPSKISFKEVGEVNPDQFTVVRQRMLDESKCDWVLMVDGDEVWWEEKIKKLRDIIDLKGDVLDSIVSKYYNVVGDIYHFQDETAGKYNIDGKTGTYNIRAFNRHIKGIKFIKPHGQQGIVDHKDILIQNQDKDKRDWLYGYSYLHFTNMRRSEKRLNDLKVPKRKFKLKYEIGNRFPPDFYYPEVFFKEKPETIPNVWKTTNKIFKASALIQTPLKRLKRKYFSSKKSGY